MHKITKSWSAASNTQAYEADNRKGHFSVDPRNYSVNLLFPLRWYQLWEPFVKSREFLSFANIFWKHQRPKTAMFYFQHTFIMFLFSLACLFYTFLEYFGWVSCDVWVRASYVKKCHLACGPKAENTNVTSYFVIFHGSFFVENFSSVSCWNTGYILTSLYTSFSIDAVVLLIWLWSFSINSPFLYDKAWCTVNFAPH